MSATLTFFDSKKNRTVGNDDFNVSNSNAAAILASLGLPLDCDSPPIEIIEFEKSLCRFLDSEIPSIVDCGKDAVQNSNWIDCGRREGYLTEKITLALELTRKARMNGATCAYFS